MNYYLVKYQGKEKRIMTGLEISLLQQSGAKVKIIKKVSKRDYAKKRKL